MTSFYFTKQAKKFFLGLSKVEQERISEKFKFLKNHNDIFSIIERIKHLKEATHKFRVGKWRIVLRSVLEENGNYEFDILKIGHRRDIYK